MWFQFVILDSRAAILVVFYGLKRYFGFVQGGRVDSDCPKAAVTLKAEDTGSTAGGEKQKGE